MENTPITINQLFPSFDSLAEKSKLKIRFLVKAGSVDPLEEYRLNPVETANGWTFYYKKKKPFKIGDIVLTFVRMETPGLWLFIGEKKIISDGGDHHYIGEDLHDFDGYINRLVVLYKNKSQNLVRQYGKISNDMHISQILAQDYTGERFPGYSKVNISFKRLKYVVDNRLESWITGLQNVKAVYLITDVKSHRLYVGSATSENGMLLGRWSQYIETGHGGNVELKKLPYEYIRDNFRFSILQSFTPNTPDEDILMWESEFKDRLQTREAGYNAN